MKKPIHENTPRMKRSDLRDPNALAPLSYRSLVPADSAPYEEIGYATYMHFLPLPTKKRLWRRALAVLNEQPCLLDSNSTSTTNTPRNPSQKGERRYFTHRERDPM